MSSNAAGPAPDHYGTGFIPREAIPYDKAKYRQRNEVERLFNRLKQFRRVATRYEKLDGTFLAFIHLTAALVMIR